MTPIFRKQAFPDPKSAARHPVPTHNGITFLHHNPTLRATSPTP